MFLNIASVYWDRLGFPRIRGDVPKKLEALNKAEEFSPHTRGCSADKRNAQALTIVFPAYAGMFLVAA